MNINIPEYIEGTLDSQFKGSLEGVGVFYQYAINSGSKYSIVLYKDFRIENAEAISEEVFLSAKESQDWWKIDHSAEAAIEFLKPFYREFSFLRHKPIEIFVNHPQIAFQDKRNSGSDSYGKIYGKIRARLIYPEKKEIIASIKTAEPLIGETVIVQEPDKTCFESRGSSCFGLNEGPTRAGGCYGLSGGSLGIRGCFGNYGNPKGCYNFNNTSGCFPSHNTPGCFPNLSFGCLIPFLFLLVLFLIMFKSCHHINNLAPVLNTIIRDSDDIGKTMPDSLGNENNDSIFSRNEILDRKGDLLYNYDSISTKNKMNLFESDSIIQKQLGKGEVALLLWGLDEEDNDSISLYLNNVVIADKIRLQNNPIIIRTKGLKYGENYLIVESMISNVGINAARIKGYSDQSIVCDTQLVLSSQISRLTLIYK